MHRRGPVPKPPLKLLPGTGSRRRTPVPAARLPEPPSWLNLPQRTTWERVTSELDAAGIGALRIDQDILVAYCVAVCQMQDAAELLAKDGPIVRGANGGRVRHPAAILFGQSARLVDSLASSLGLTPDARARMRLSVPNTEAAHTDIDDLFA